MTTIIKAPNIHTYTEVELIKKIQQIDIYSLESYQEAKFLLKLSSEYNYTIAVIKAYCAIGYIYTLRAEYELARAAFSKALIIFEDTKQSTLLNENEKLKLEMQLEGGIGNTYALQNSIALALPYYYKALQIAEKIEDGQQISNYLSNIGTIHVKNFNVDRGLSYFMRAKDVILKEKVKRNLDSLYCNIATCFFEKKADKETFLYLQKALEAASETKNKNTIAIIYINYADLYVMNKEYELALKSAILGL
ncbi:MAG: tetratricopeptide repeat protein [Chitinophagales bacterium]